MPISPSPGARRVRFWLWLATALLGVPAPAAAQHSNLPQLRRAMDAYHGGDLAAAEAMLDSLPAGLAGDDLAVAEVYRGLIAFAREARNTAGEAFRRALEAHPPVRLDDQVHSPSRVALFDSVRTDLLSRWRGAALSAERRGERDAAMSRWRAVLAAEPSDPIAAEGVRRLMAGDELRMDRLAGPPAEPQRPTPIRPYSPWAAVGLGLLLPGGGEFYVGRPGRGAAVLALAGGAAVAGLLFTRVEVSCRTPTAGECPPEDVLDERETRPYLGPGLAAAAVITLIGAIDAGLSAARSPAAGAAQAASRAASRASVGTDGRIHVMLFRLTH